MHTEMTGIFVNVSSLLLLLPALPTGKTSEASQSYFSSSCWISESEALSPSSFRLCLISPASITPGLEAQFNGGAYYVHLDWRHSSMEGLTMCHQSHLDWKHSSMEGLTMCHQSHLDWKHSSMEGLTTCTWIGSTVQWRGLLRAINHTWIGSTVHWRGLLCATLSWTVCRRGTGSPPS